VDTEQILSELREDTALVSIMAANNETGAIQPVGNIVKKVKKISPRTVFHTDAVQFFGKEQLNAVEFDADLITISGHKIHGPKGIGALYVKNGVKIDNIVFGGHHERGIRPGTENVSFIAGLGKAAEAVSHQQAGKDYRRIEELREMLIGGLLNIPGEVIINGSPDKSLVNTLNVSFKNIEGESVIMMLDSVGIAVSSGSACTSGAVEPSHVLSAMGIDPVTAQGSVRFSLSKYNTKEEIAYVIKQAGPIVKKLRDISPL
jgi:cysteine desulfurase